MENRMTVKDAALIIKAGNTKENYNELKALSKSFPGLVNAITPLVNNEDFINFLSFLPEKVGPRTIENHIREEVEYVNPKKLKDVEDDKKASKKAKKSKKAKDEDEEDEVEELDEEEAEDEEDAEEEEEAPKKAKRGKKAKRSKKAKKAEKAAEAEEDDDFDFE